MRTPGRVVFIAAAAAAYAGVALAQAPAPADLVFINGKVITVDAKDTIARGVAVKGERIVAVGDVAAWRGPNTKVIDLKGRALLPGFIDSHSHVAGMANTEAHHINIQVPPLKDGAAVIAKLQAEAAKRPPGAWLVGQGTYNQVMPTREALDAGLPNNPVDLQWSIHDHLINSKAAQVMGLTRAYPDPDPALGRFERAPNGEVMIIRDAAAPWPANKTAKFTPQERKEAIRGILEDFYLKKGVTAVSDMSDIDAYRAMAELKSEGRLPTRVRMNYYVGVMAVPGITSISAQDPSPVGRLAELGIKPTDGDRWLHAGGVKYVQDGVWGTTAGVYKPFWNGSGTTWIPNNTGSVTYQQDRLNRLVLEAHKAGWQVLTHANGDRAQDMVISAYEAAQKAAPRPDPRFRIEHYGHFLVQDARTEERIQRMHRSKVIASPQPVFLWRLTDVNVQEPDVKFFPMKTLIDRGFRPAGGVDTIGTQNFATPPMFSIERMVERKTKYGAVAQGEEAISVMDGIRMFTIWSAEANFMEKDFGSIEVGKIADLVVLERDPLTAPYDQLDEIDVDMTVLDGKVAYQRN
ncbi:amidohydrolase [Phenylobacterium sp.]|jgi:predicted amidohydrolase YtcJ|uniref:amidohydrolase n=1 Tax=Phenylobacterium sp. TaxID=1871053 RepID=UPI003782EAD7